MRRMDAEPPARIRALPERLANQIAAGEVVERPASVLKELLENSLDAGAARIGVDVEHGGARLIRVRDDGVGICREDLALALDRHATSKIASLDDLENVASLGFRGEALPSIASVSRLELSSCPAGGESGWQLAAEGCAAQASPQPVPHPQGTTVTVRDLFYNTPARRKFLRTEKTEYRHLEDVLKRAALSRFDCAFRLRHNGRESYSLPAASSDAERARRVAKLCGAAFMEQALALSFEAAELQLAGWIGAPGYSRGVSDLQYFFVNGRMVRDNLLRHAVRHAHHGVIESGRQPAYVLFLRVSPAQVDVNVHPSKHEVRFRDARSVHDFIVRSLRQALSTDTELTDHRSGEVLFAPMSSPASESRDGRGTSPGMDEVERSRMPEPRAKQAGIVPDNPLHSRHPWRSDARADGMGVGAPSPVRHGELREHAAAYNVLRTVPVEQSSPVAGNRPLGEALQQIDRRYVVARNAHGLVVVDARRACRLVAAERLAAALGNASITSRPLLVPVAVTVDEQQADLLESRAAFLENLGIDLRRVAHATISCRRIPAPLAAALPQDLVLSVADALGRTDPSVESPGAFPAVLDAVLEQCDLTAGWSWDRDAMNDLLRQLERLRDSSKTQAGEPIWRQLSADDLAALLGPSARSGVT